MNITMTFDAGPPGWTSAIITFVRLLDGNSAELSTEDIRNMLAVLSAELDDFDWMKDIDNPAADHPFIIRDLRIIADWLESNLTAMRARREVPA